MSAFRSSTSSRGTNTNSASGSMKPVDQPRTGDPVNVRSGQHHPIHLGPGSVARVDVRSMKQEESRWLRFRDAADIEALSLYDVEWPSSDGGCRVGDEDDLDEGWPSGPSALEVERVYRALRKNRKDRNDRVGAHKWYFAEMEVGRKNAPRWSLKRISRAFYRRTSNYGLSAIRPALWLLAVAALAFCFLMIPVTWVCPTVASPSGPVCAGWETGLKTIVLAAFFQPAPADVHLSGLIPVAVWLFARLFGAAMLVSIAVAFRNQVAR